MLYPPRETITYKILEGLWIIASDRIAAWLSPIPQVFLRINTYKGWFFIAAPAAWFPLEHRRETKPGKGNMFAVLLHTFKEMD
jgi:hypothetical protein